MTVTRPLVIALTIALLGSMAVLAKPPSVLALNEDFYQSSRHHFQWTDHYCVPASAEGELDYINSTTADTDKSTQDAYFEYGQNHGKGQYADSYGVDPRGWAYILWNNSPPYYSYNDYRYDDVGLHQIDADYALAWSLHETQKPAGVVVWNGKHAIVAVGYQATASLPLGGQLQGFWVWDPLRDAGYYYEHWGWGIVANSYYTLDAFNGTDSWPRTMFSTNWASATPGVSYWKGWYVLLLRSSANGPHPQDNPPVPWGGQPHYAPSAPAPVPEASSPDEALRQGLDENGLTGGQGRTGDLSDVTVGRTIDVLPAEDGILPYMLAEVVSHGRVVAIAQLVKGQNGFQFAALAQITDGRLPTVADVSATATALGVAGASAQAVWGPSDESTSPFYPIWQFSSPASRRFLTPSGTVLDTMPLYSGYGSVS